MEIKVSVIVPVYNTREYLDKCLMSLLNQTLKEKEIILVDDGSTDGSGEVLEEYAQKYPEMKVIHTENGGQGRARNIGIAAAKGTYLMFCDSDDYFREDAFEKMYHIALEGEHDLVYAPEHRIRGNNQYILGEMEVPLTKESLILNMSLIAFHSLLVKKELMVQTGDIPEIIFEDVAYVPVLVSNAQNLGYCNTPLYYYVERNTSTLFRTKEEKILDLKQAVEFALANIHPDYYDASVMTMALKEVDKVRGIWYFGDVILEHLWSLEDKIKNNPYYLEEPEKYKEITAFLKLSRKPYEKILYVNGFGGQDNSRIQGGFREEGRRQVLSEDNCDIGCNEKIRLLYECKDYESVASYFAMKKIIQTGGIYVSNDMRITGVFDSTRYFPAFFGYQDEENFTDKVFGGVPGNEPMKEILKHYEEHRDLSMAEAIRETLVELYQVQLNGRSNYTKYPVLLLAPLAVIANAGSRIALTEQCNYTEETIPITKATLETIYNYPTGWQIAQLRHEKLKVRKQRTKICQKNERIEELKEKLVTERQNHKDTKQELKQGAQELKELKKETNKIKNSQAYKAGLFLTKSRIGRLLIKICLKLSKDGSHEA